MNLISGLSRYRGGQRLFLPGMEGAGDDHSLARRMRTAAVELRAEGRAKLKLPRREMEEIRSVRAEAERIRMGCLDGGEALERLSQDGGLMEACAEQATLDGAEDLPAAGRSARIDCVLNVLCCGGDICLTRERLLLGIASFDDVQPLEMAELWAVPQAVRINLCRSYLEAAREILAVAGERRLAERWVNGAHVKLSKRSAVFFEHALHLLSEQEEGRRYAALEKHLADRGTSVQQAVRLAHGQESLLRMRMENIAAGKRLIDGLKWQECFEILSSVEQELNYDPAGVYPAMEEDSRAAVRSQTALLARKLKLGELTVARHAVRAAQLAKEEGACEAKCTVCHWLYDDAGRRELVRRMGGAGAVLPKMVPDPTGRKSAALISALFAVSFGLYLAAVRNIWFVMMGIPLAWGASMALLGRLFPLFVKPAKLLKLKLGSVPDELRTLVVMPVLLSDVGRAEEICDQFEALGCLEKDENIRWLILGDFADADSEHTDGDDAITACVRARIARMNDRAGREQFYYLHRGRSLLKIDGRWMGRDRKRGALMDLNRLLLGETGAEEAFSAEGEACSKLCGTIRFVLTLDADTRFLPGTVRRMIGTLAHPMNRVRTENGVRRGYAVMQPQMEMTASACINGFVRLFAGEGGMSSYSGSVSGYWQDVTGVGLFGGKGIYDVRAFHESLDGALPEGKILSHDLIEGTLAGCAQVSDVRFYDGHPPALGSYLKRLNRWTRGDWQLLPLLLSGRKYPSREGSLTAAERLRLLDNLLRSLWAPSLMGLLTQAIWMGHDGALALGLLLGFLTPLLMGFDGRAWSRALAELTVLPAVAACTADAAVRSLWRMTVTKRHLLDWVTSADAEKSASNPKAANRIAAILLIPGLFVPGMQPAALALGALFLVGPGWMRALEQERTDADLLSETDARLFWDIARDTWRFFETYVSEETHFLPPDNVQLDPDVGAARRTSPTNIGLYLMSCAAARSMEFIDEAELIRRVGATVETIERMEKWRGHLYNWYDTQTLRPLHPRYVSSVDSGNLAASLLLCASALGEGELSERMRAIAKQTDFAALYDAERDLFRIGADAERNRLSEAHYDLLASESRILSYTAMMLGQVPLRHWARLGRASTALREGMTLVSWSGTMFEYLMPELYMHAPKNTLLGSALQTAVRAQQTLGRKKNRPWGVSESGFCALDLWLNYQYRAFGLKSLSMSGRAQEDVVAPYATALAAHCAKADAAENFRRMEALGWRGGMGFYEAADFRLSGTPSVVKSYMAHHQGMTLCALCNLLTERSLSRAFQKIPEARALELLLEERALPKAQPVRQRIAVQIDSPAAERQRGERRAKPQRRIIDAHLLGGAGATALVTADGMLHYSRNGVMATRFSGNLIGRGDGACTHIRLERTGESRIVCGETVYRPGGAMIRCDVGCIECEMKTGISPEDGTLIKRLEIVNTSETEETVRVMDCVPVALDRYEDQLAHPVFRHLFVESERIKKHVLLFRRCPRQEGDVRSVLMHMISAPGSIQAGTDYDNLVGRSGSTMQPGGVNWELSGTVGATLNPCSALETMVTLAPGERIEIHFALGLIEDEDAEAWQNRNFSDDMAERALQLSSIQASSMLGFLGLDASRAGLLARFSAMLFDASLHMPADARRGEASSSRRGTLWTLGISGDVPMIMLHVSDAGHIKTVREVMRAHEYYRSLGIQVDLVLVDEYGCDYAQPVRDALLEAISFSYLSGLQGAKGGVHLLEGRQMNSDQRTALHRAAALDAEASRDFYAQVREKLTALDMPTQRAERLQTGRNCLQPVKSGDGSGFGGYLADGRYAIDVLPDRPTPAPWSNQMANDRFGILTTERGGGFLWYENSRSGRLTTFSNDALSEGWGWMLYLVNEESGQYMPLLPGEGAKVPFRAIFGPSETQWRFETQMLSGELAMCVRTDAPELRMHLTVKSSAGGRFRLVGFVDWLMGESTADAAFLRTWSRDGACFAAGNMDGVGYFAAANARVQNGCDRRSFLGRGTIAAPEGISGREGGCGGWVLNVPVELQANIPNRSDWVIGAAGDAQTAYARVRSFYAKPDYEAVRSGAMEEWKRRRGRLEIETPDENINRLANGWLMHQTLTARIRARTGLYQPGGAYGFRDQLQDMLALLPGEPDRVREHILRCAAHQFEDGDVMHWWHEPCFGVRTRISDDMLFLPFVTSSYVKRTNDSAILKEEIAYLANVGIPERREDICCEMHPGDVRETLHGHCMRAFRRASETGSHGLALIGGGDWNDGMNRVGTGGRGESVWLSEFLIACAEEYAGIAPEPSDREWLIALAERLKGAVEASGWDGEWYLRAYTDDGRLLGSAQSNACRIDAISQAWAVLAGLDEERSRMAVDSAWKMLADERTGILRLLTPPFDESDADIGYIASYPKGVRENGGQYTHGACWLLLALIRLGDAGRAHRLLGMLMPQRHVDTPEKARLYRVEPYVLAADVYDGAYAGRGGWTWYTGSAAWLYVCILELLGYERQGNRVRMHSLLGDWPEAAATVRHGRSKYRLISRRDAEEILLDGKPAEEEWVELIDDGCDHEAVFPARIIPPVDLQPHRAVL